MQQKRYYFFYPFSLRSFDNETLSGSSVPFGLKFSLQAGSLKSFFHLSNGQDRSVGLPSNDKFSNFISGVA